MCLLFILPLFKAYLHVVSARMALSLGWQCTDHLTIHQPTHAHINPGGLWLLGQITSTSYCLRCELDRKQHSIYFLFSSCSPDSSNTVSNTDETLCCAMIRWAWRWTINNHKFDFIGHFKKWICFNSKPKINVRSLQKFMVSSADSTESLLQNTPHDLKSNKGTIFRDYI